MRTCGDVMEKSFVYLDDGETARQAAELMERAHVAFLAVCDREGRLVGTLTDRSLLYGLARLDRPASVLAIGVLMRTPTLVLHPWERLEEALRLMRDHRESILPVVRTDGNLCGLLRLPEVQRLLAQRQTQGTDYFGSEESSSLP